MKNKKGFYEVALASLSITWIMFTTVQAVSTSKTSRKKSYECETSVTIAKKTQSSNIHIYTSNWVIEYIHIYPHTNICSCTVNVNLCSCTVNVNLMLICIELSELFIVKMPESSNISFGITLFCQSILS